MFSLSIILFDFLLVFSGLYNSASTSKNDVNDCQKDPQCQEKSVVSNKVINKNAENGFHIVIRPILEDPFLPNYGSRNNEIPREKRLTDNQEIPRIVKVALTSYMGPKRQKRRASKKKNKKRVCVRATTIYPPLREVDVTIDKNLIGKVPVDLDTEANTVVIATVNGNADILKMPKKMSDVDYEQVDNLGVDSENEKSLSKSEAKKKIGIDLDVVNKKKKIKTEDKTKAKKDKRHKTHRKRRQIP